MEKKWGVSREPHKRRASESDTRELNLRDDPDPAAGVNPYESIGAVAANQLKRRWREPDHATPVTEAKSGCNPYEHGAKAPELAWNGAGLDTRDVVEEKATWMERKLGRKARRR